MLKLFLAPALVVASSLAGRRWGPGLAGTLVALPIVAGPILAITLLDHGPAFAARAAGSSLLGLVSLALFAVVFAELSRLPRTGHWVPALLLAWSACLAADLLLAQLSVPPVLALGLSFTATACGVKALARTTGGPVPPSPRPPRWDLPARAAATALLVTALTTAAAQLGPGTTGVLAPFPIGTSVVAAFALAQGGPAVAGATLRGVLRGLWGFAVFCFLVAVLAEPLGGGTAFAIAVVCTLKLQLAIGRLQSARIARRSHLAAHADQDWAGAGRGPGLQAEHACRAPGSRSVSGRP
ncbi:hypothetical protein ACGFX4_41290 [Kitasatospora sp. NPDC048365]|uniref:hypothetical protein n=1 Tax=Kitasatospora sp. NPDC048365 TaxID=3364050 RepID=UPI00371FD084